MTDLNPSSFYTFISSHICNSFKFAARTEDTYRDPYKAIIPLNVTFQFVCWLLKAGTLAVAGVVIGGNPAWAKCLAVKRINWFHMD